LFWLVHGGFWAINELPRRSFSGFWKELGLVCTSSHAGFANPTFPLA